MHPGVNSSQVIDGVDVAQIKAFLRGDIERAKRGFADATIWLLVTDLTGVGDGAGMIVGTGVFVGIGVSVGAVFDGIEDFPSRGAFGWTLRRLEDVVKPA